MKRLIEKFMLFVSILLFVSFAQADQIEAAAKASCKCQASMHMMMQEMQVAIKSGDNAKMMEISTAMEENDEFQACMDDVFKKYETLASDEQKSAKVEQRMGKLCPPPVPGMPGM